MRTSADLILVCPQSLHSMCFNNFRHNLSNALMALTFGSFNDLCALVHGMEIYLNKCKKEHQESGRTGQSITAVVAPKTEPPTPLVVLF